MNYSATGGIQGIAITVVVFALLCLITFACFAYSSRILAVVGEHILAIITRLMGKLQSEPVDW